MSQTMLYNRTTVLSCSTDMALKLSPEEFNRSVYVYIFSNIRTADRNFSVIILYVASFCPKHLQKENNFWSTALKLSQHFYYCRIGNMINIVFV